MRTHGGDVSTRCDLFDHLLNDIAVIVTSITWIALDVIRGANRNDLDRLVGRSFEAPVLCSI